MAQSTPLDPLDTIAGLNKAFRDGTTTPSAATRRYLDRIERHDRKIGAYQLVRAEQAMAAAEAADKAIAAGSRIGPFHGIPFALKDIYELEGEVTTCGSRAMADRVSEHTGSVVRRLMAAGGIILGKSKTVECAFGAWGTNQHMGTPLNPWDQQTPRIPGGSSSGSAAAVASGLAACAVGSDTGGSVRLPAAFCGIVGLKVTAGRLPLDGIAPLSQTLDTPGPIVQTVRDALIMFEVMDGREGWKIDDDLATDGGVYGMLQRGVDGLRIGILNQAERDACVPEMLAAYDMTVETLRSLGAETIVFDAPFHYADLADLNGLITAVEGYQNHGTYYDDMTLPMDEDVRQRMLGGKTQTGWAYVRCLEERKQMTRRFAEAMRGLDALVTPSTTTLALALPDVDQTKSPTHFARPFNYLGMCGLSLPAALSDSGLPASIQVACRADDEALALRIGAALEAALPAIGRPVIED